MKLTALYESMAGYGMGYQVLGGATKPGARDMFRPRTPERWYFRNSPNTLQHRDKQELEFPLQTPISTLAETCFQGETCDELCRGCESLLVGGEIADGYCGGCKETVT